MNFLKKLIPGFLHDLDFKLLSNAPLWWSFKLHYHLYFIIVVNLILLGIGALYSVSVKNLPQIEVLFSTLMIPALIYLALWLLKLNQFNIETSFGRQKTYQSTGKFLIYFISIGLMVSFMYTLPLLTTYKTKHLLTDEQLLDDINTLNKADHYFNLSYNYYESEKHYHSANKDDTEEYYYSWEATREKDTITKCKQRIAYLQEVRPQSDSINIYRKFIKKRHSKLIYEFDGYAAFTPYTWSKDTLALRTWELRDNYLKTRSKEEKIEEIKEYMSIHQKYGGSFINEDPETILRVVEMYKSNPFMDMPIYHRYSDGEGHYSWPADSKYTIIRNKYEVQDNIRYIGKCKDYNFFFFNEWGMFHIWFFIVFYSTILFMMYRNVSWRVFVAFIITACLLPIIIGLLDSLFWAHGDFAEIIFVFGFIATVVLTILMKNMKRKSGFRTVVLMICTIVSPVYFVTLCGIYNELEDLMEDAYIRIVYGKNLPKSFYESTEYYEADEHAIISLMYIWAALFIFVLLPLFKKMFIRNISLPSKT